MNINNKQVIADATAEAAGVAANVLVLARLLKVTPANLAKAIAETDSSGDFLADFTAELVKARLVEARKEADAE